MFISVSRKQVSGNRNQLTEFCYPTPYDPQTHCLNSKCYRVHPLSSYQSSTSILTNSLYLKVHHPNVNYLLIPDACFLIPERLLLKLTSHFSYACDSEILFLMKTSPMAKFPQRASSPSHFLLYKIRKDSHNQSAPKNISSKSLHHKRFLINPRSHEN